MLKHDRLVRQKRSGAVFARAFMALKAFMLLVGLVLVACLVWFYVAAFFEFVSPEESVRIARKDLEGFLKNSFFARPNEVEKLRYAVCEYHPASSEEPEKWVGCIIDIKGEDEIIYFSAYLNIFGKPTHSSFERIKR
jgi:hypothetical protein